MNEGLSPAQIALLIGYAAAMTGGQLLFKVAALRAAAAASPGERLLAMLANGFFLAAVLLYGALAVLWVWILSFTPLSRAYIFVALAFAATPLLGAIVFLEPISPRLVTGIGLIVCGLLLVAG
jgi:drug/metabolite transporter (DMT)-like permease